MTDTTPQLAVRPPLRRSHDNRVIAGVAGGVGRWLGIDPVVVRVVLVVLAIFGGSGLLLYGAGWLLIPDDGEEANGVTRFIDRTGKPGSTGRTAVIVAAACLGVLAIGGAIGAGPFHGVWFLGGGGSLLLLLVAGGLVLWLLNRAPATAQTSTIAMAPSAPVESPLTETGYSFGGYGDYPGYTAPVPAPTPPATRPRSYLGAATLSIALLVLGALITLNITEVTDIPAVVVLASGLAVLGIGLLAGSAFGRARWLLAIAIPLLVVTSIVAVVPSNLRLGTEFGDLEWRPTTPSAVLDEYRVDIGQGRLDLTDLVLPPGTTTYPITASVGIGELDVLVPEGVNVIVDASVSAGRIAIEGLPERDGTQQNVSGVIPGIVDPTSPTINLTLEVGLGNMEVSRA